MSILALTIVVAAAGAVDTSAAQKEIATACGVSPAVVVSWEEFGDNEDAKAGFSAAGLSFLSGAFGELCKDAGMKAEVGKQISKIVLSQAYGAADPVIYLAQKTLHVEYLWVKGEPGPDKMLVRDEIAARLKGEEAEAP